MLSGFMKFTLRHLLLGISVIAVIFACWMAVDNFLDHQGDGLKRSTYFRLEYVVRKFYRLNF